MRPGRPERSAPGRTSLKGTVRLDRPDCEIFRLGLACSCQFLLFDRANPCAARLRIESISDPNNHYGVGGERPTLGVENFRASGSEGAGLIVAELMQEARFAGVVRIRGVDAIDISPNNELVGVHGVRDDGSGKIRAVAAKRGDAAIGRRTNEAGNDGYDAGFEERKKNAAAALPGLFEVRLRVAKRIAGQDKIRRRDRHRGDAQLFERGGKQPRAEAFAKRGETIEESRAG